MKTTPSRELLALAQVYLTAGDTAATAAAIDLRLSRTRTEQERLQVLSDAIALYLDRTTAPIRVNTLKTRISQLDAMRSQAAKVIQAETHMGYGFLLMTRGEAYDSLAYKEFDIAIAIGESVDSAHREQVRITLQNAQGFKQMLSAMRGEQTGGELVSLLGKPAPPIQGQLISGTAGQRPTPGKVTLIIFQAGTSRESVAALHRLKAIFGDSVEFVFAGKTLGHFKIQGPLTYEQELQMLTDFYVKNLKVPGSVFVEHTQISTRPDGRLVRHPTANDQAYSPVFPFVLTDRQGVVRRMFLYFLPQMELRIQHGIEQVLQQ
jgi:hypothetical protein